MNDKSQDDGERRFRLVGNDKPDIGAADEQFDMNEDELEAIGSMLLLVLWVKASGSFDEAAKSLNQILGEEELAEFRQMVPQAYGGDASDPGLIEAFEGMIENAVDTLPEMMGVEYEQFKATVEASNAGELDIAELFGEEEDGVEQ